MPLRIADILKTVEEFKEAQTAGTVEAYSQDDFTALYSYVVLSLAEQDKSIKWDKKDRELLNGELGKLLPHYLEWRAGQRLRFRAQINPPPKPMAVLRPELATSYSFKEQPGVRKEVAGVMGIKDMGHEVHGANSTASRTLKDIIDNLFDPCRFWPVEKQEEIAAKLLTRYGYSPIA